MKALLFLISFIYFTGNLSDAAPLTRDTITTIPAGTIAYDQKPLRDVLLDCKKLAQEKNIPLRAENDALEAAQNITITLHAEGLTLDGLLEYVTHVSGNEWHLDESGILVYSNQKLRAAHLKRAKSAARKQLATVIIPEISFQGIKPADAYFQARQKAVKIAGLGAVPKLDIPPLPGTTSNIRFKASNISVPALFDLIAAASAGSIDWKMKGTQIALIDEEQRVENEAARRRQLAESRANRNSNVDPFAAPGHYAPPVDRPAPISGTDRSFNTESYDHFGDNPFFSPRQEPLSTFSVDVDTASYSNIRRMIRQGTRIPIDAARIEEFINYFPYDYTPPAADEKASPEAAPFTANLEVASAPWAPSHRLVRVGLKGREIDWAKRPASNLTFLLDVSGSMESPDKLPLVKEALELLALRLGPEDRVSIVVYAGASGLVLPPTPGDQPEKILAAIEKLSAGGSTNGGEGIELAYKTATENLIKGGNNRVIICTDGDFNVGITDQGSLVRRIEQEAKSGIFLTILGFGNGNYKDDILETLSNKGNGNHFYIDSAREARKIFVHGLSGTLVTIAKDVKIQVEFNPAKVGAYRLIGYENRLLETQDFDDDSKDAGDIGAGHTVTAFYEIIAPGEEEEVLKSIAPLKYQKPGEKTDGTSDELLTVKLRYKQPEGDQSKLLSFPLIDPGTPFADASTDFRFASAVAAFGMILRDSDYRGDAKLPMVSKIAKGSLGDDKHEFRKEFVEIVEEFGILR